MLPRVIPHNTVTIDSRIDWFTADIALFYELCSRWSDKALLVCSDTILNVPEKIAEK